MGTPTITLEQAKEAHKALCQFGSQVAAAEALNLSRGGLQGRLRAYESFVNRDPAIQASMDAVGTQMEPRLAWAKVPAKDGQPGYSVLLKPQELPDDMLLRMRDAFEGMDPAPDVEAPQNTLDDLCTVYPIADAHIGMMAWGRETGEDYDTKIACDRLRDWMGRCVASAPASDTAVILDVGDGQHADDQSNQTPRSHHQLDVDTRHFRTLDMSIEALGSAVELARQKHRNVIVRILPGNHNPTSYMAVMFALAERYRNEPRVNVEKDPGEFFMMEWGRVMLGAHHGHKAKPERLVHFMADQFAVMWGRTLHRYLYTAHEHHHRSADIGGVLWEKLRAMTARDAHAYSNAFSARAQIQAITYDKTRGEIHRVKVGL